MSYSRAKLVVICIIYSFSMATNSQGKRTNKPLTYLGKCVIKYIIQWYMYQKGPCVLYFKCDRVISILTGNIIEYMYLKTNE